MTNFPSDKKKYIPKITLPTLYYDHREIISKNTNTNLKRFLIDQYNFTRCNNMYVGDYQCGDMVFEIKESDDLIESIIDKRIFEQIRKMYKAKYHGRLIIHGTEEKIKQYAINHKKLHPNAFNGFIASLIEVNMIPLFVEDWFDIFEIMIRAFEKHYDGKDRVFSTPEKPVYKDPQMNKLTSLSYIGETKAKKILTHFNNDLNAFYNASVSEISKVPTIGIKTAKRIYKSIHKYNNPPFLERTSKNKDKLDNIKAIKKYDFTKDKKSYPESKSEIKHYDFT